MTIPQIPGMFSALGQGLERGLDSYNQQKQKQYEEAQTGARLIIGLMQAGRLDPSVISDPSFQQTLQTAKIPVPPAGLVVPSSAAARERTIAQRGQAVEPGSIAEDVLYDIPGEGQISETRLKAALNNFKLAAAQNPALANLMTDLVPADIAQGRELSARASISPEEYVFAADNFVANAGGDPVQAKRLAQADPQYAQLVTSGQLSDEYFAAAARRWSLMDENMRIRRAEALTRRAAIDRDYQTFQAQDRSFDTEVQRLLKVMDQNVLDTTDNAMLGLVRKKLQADPNYQPKGLEQGALDKYNRYVNAQLELDNLQNQRGELRGQFIGRKNPPPPSGEVDPAIVSTLRGALRRGQKTVQDILTSQRISEPIKEAVLGDQYVPPNKRKAVP
jgi:hypothetical protein